MPRLMDVPRAMRAQGVMTARNAAGAFWWQAQGAAERGQADAAAHLMGRSDHLRAQADTLARTLR